MITSPSQFVTSLVRLCQLEPFVSLSNSEIRLGEMINRQNGEDRGTSG